MSGPDPTGRAVLALDELLRSPNLPAVVHQARALFPTWMLDQFDAATSEVKRGTDAAIDRGMLTGRALLPNGDHPDWARLGLLDALVKWLAGRGSTCMHSPHHTRPQPIVAAAWRPGLVVCGACTQLLAITRDSAADRTCDGCGRVVAGLDAGEPIWSGAVQAGLVSYLFGACGGCKYWSDDAGGE